MVALVTGDFTITLEDRNRESKKRRNRVKLVFGDGAKTYPAAGVPIPVYSSLGLVRNLDYIILTDGDDASGILWKYDQANKKLRGYLSSGGGAAALAASAGSTATGATPVTSTGASPATVITPGTLVELTTGLAPAAQTIYAEVVGW